MDEFPTKTSIYRAVDGISKYTIHGSYGYIYIYTIHVEKKPWPNPQAGKVSHALSAGSIVSAGELLAKLELKDPSKVAGMCRMDTYKKGDSWGFPMDWKPPYEC